MQNGAQCRIPDDSGKKSGTDWVLPKIIGSDQVSGTRQALVLTQSLHCCVGQQPERPKGANDKVKQA